MLVALAGEEAGRSLVVNFVSCVSAGSRSVGQMAETETDYDLTDRELASRIWSRLQPYRKRIVWALTLLVLAVPFII